MNDNSIYFLTACAPAAAEAGPHDDCGQIEPSRQDIEEILSFGAEAFPFEEWARKYTVEPYKMTLFRQKEAESAIAYIEYLVYTCGYGQEELDEYFSDAGFAIAFGGYESHTMAAFCEQGNLALYKFDLMNEGVEYTSHYWVEQTDDTHVLAVMLVFPKAGSAQLDEYCRKLFPKLTSCHQP